MTRHYSSSHINGYRRKSKTPDLELAPLRTSSPARTAEVQPVQWRITQVFADQEEALINKKLPKELLLRIFSFLDVVSLCRSAQVSRAWNLLALDGSNWQEVDLFEFQVDVEGIVEIGSVRGVAVFWAFRTKSPSNLSPMRIVQAPLSTITDNLPGTCVAEWL